MKKNNFLLRTDLKFCSEKFFKIKKLFTIILLMVVIFSAFGNKGYSQDTFDNDAAAILQQQRVTGTVTNEAGDPLPGATVQVEGTVSGAITDINGKYSIDIPDQNAIISISFVGYITQKIPIAGKTVIDVSMVPTLESLQEVVVIGYGTQKRTTITGSVSIVKGEDIASVPVANITNSIAGKLAGVSMRPNGGQPGEDNADIHIRGVATTGANQPLIVVDGIIRDNINQVDPSIIASVSILKDAAAVAPYGLGGANGVILITTKQGVVGAPTLTLNSYYGWQQPTYFPDLLDAVGYMNLANEAYVNEHPGLTSYPFDPAMISNYASLNASDPDRYPNSNTDDLINMSVPIQNYNLQLRGGSEKMKYFASIGYYKQDGVLDAVNYKRFNYNMNVESKVTNTTTVTLAILGSVERTNDLDVQSSANQIFRSGYKFIPTQPIYYTNGKWGQFAGNSPVGVINSGGYDKIDGNTLLTTLAIEQQLPFIKGLSVKGTASFDTRNTFEKGWHKPFYFWSQDLNTTPYTYTKDISTQEGGAAAYTYLIQDQRLRKYYTFQGYVNYARSFGKHDITALFVAEARNNTEDRLTARRNNFAIAVDEMDMGSSDKLDYDNTGSSYVGAQVGYVYRVGYVYNNKYMLEASGRYDGHYYFAPGKRWGYFPAFSAGWRVSEEDFMKNLSFVNSLKIRGSWGKAGNLAGDPYQYLSGYTLAGNGYAFGTGKMVQRAYSPQEANSNITWEISTKTDVGFEASLWNSLLMVEFDYFTENRTGMLLAPEVTVPIEYGLALAQENAGEMQNRGFELSVGSRYELQNGLRLGINANISIAKNEMVQIFETAATYDNPNRRRTGKAYGTQFGYHALGLFSTADDANGNGIIDLSEYPVTQFGELHPGDVKYEDISGANGDMIPDGKIDSNDEIEIGYPFGTDANGDTFSYPLMTFGFTPTAEWKGFDLSLFFQGSAMSSMPINSFQTIPFNNNSSNTDYEYYNNHWTVDNQNATYPRANSAPVSNNTQSSDFWIRDLNFLRLKTATLGYTLPKSVTNFLSIQSVRVYFSGQNMLTLSSLKFMDPEMGYDRREVAYPNMKSSTFGINVTF